MTIRTEEKSKAVDPEYVAIVEPVRGSEHPVHLMYVELIDGVYVVSPQCVRPVAEMLRRSLFDVAMVRQSAEGRETKAAIVYQYLTGSRFRQHMHAIVEAFTTMQEDLSAEKKALTKQWAKREMEIERLMMSTAGLCGDLQGIVGRSLVEVEGLQLTASEIRVIGRSSNGE